MSVSFRKEKQSDILLVKEYQFKISLSNDTSNIFEQAYNHLDSLEEFKGFLSV